LSAYADQEELDKLKAWWKNYGNSAIIGVLLGIVLLVGFRYWTQHTEQRLQAASGLYDQMLQDFRTSKASVARQSGESLLNDYTSTPYAGLAGLILARMDFEENDMASARKHLQWVVDHAKYPATVHAARLRLARLVLDSGDKPAAMVLLEVKDKAGFESEYAELKGDIHRTQGQTAEARAAYREALKQLSAGSPYASVLKMKIDDLGPEKSS
jgi:predicted negative regulator of RcsB-dependent stress response